MFYISGDIHGCVEEVISFCERNKLDSDDTIILIGNVGLNYFGNENGDRKRKMALNDCGANILCIHGNHKLRPETIDTYRKAEQYGGIVYVEDDFPNLAFAIDGNIYNFDGITAIAIGGAYSVDKYYRLARNAQWFVDEQPSDKMRFMMHDYEVLEGKDAL